MIIKNKVNNKSCCLVAKEIKLAPIEIKIPLVRVVVLLSIYLAYWFCELKLIRFKDLVIFS